MELIVFILLGLASGFFAGLLGLGGGIITVPALTIVVLPYLNFPTNDIMHVAVASSLAAMVPIAIMSTYGHQQQQAVNWSIAIKFTPGLIVGAIVGALLTSFITRQFLQITFASFLIFIAIHSLRGEKIMAKPNQPVKNINAYVALPIASISALLGVGGGTMTVPYLSWCGIELRKAIGISAYCGLPIAIASSLTYYLMQYTNSQAVSDQFIYFPAVMGISLGGVIAAPMGAKYAHSLPIILIKRLFSLLLLLSAAKLFMII